MPTLTFEKKELEEWIKTETLQKNVKIKSLKIDKDGGMNVEFNDSNFYFTPRNMWTWISMESCYVNFKIISMKIKEKNELEVFVR